MLRQWLIVAVCVFYSCLPVLQARLCDEVRVSNNVGEFEQLRGCTVIVGSLKIVLIEKTIFSDYQNISFPELTEIRGYLLLYRVKGLTTLGKLFPNLSVIRGQTLITDYSFVLYEVTHLQETVRQLLDNSEEGLIIKNSYGRNKKFQRNSLCNLIVRNELKNSVDKKISTQRFVTLAKEINDIFIHEEAPIYYLPYTKGNDGKVVAARGKLWSTYIHQRQLYKKAGLLTKVANQPGSSHEPHESNEEDNDGDDVVDMLLWLKNNSEPFAEVLSNWQRTAKVRLNFDSKNETIDEYFKNYPALGKQTGHILLNSDFNYLHENKENYLFHGWPVVANVIYDALKNKKDSYLKELMTKAEEEEVTDDAKQIIALKYLPLLLQAPLIKAKGNKHWKPSKQELIDGFILFINIGLRNLQHITRGATRIERCRNLCYVNSIDWSKIGGPSHYLDTYDMEEDCPSCPQHCNGLCWNQDYCQLTETDNCDPECFGCRGPTANDCYACRSYTDNQTCVSQCPINKVRHSLSAHCVTKKECPTLLNGTWWTFQGECVNSCPPRYGQVSEEEGWCAYCGDDCTKVCSGDTPVDSTATAQELRGCTHINGSLTIRIDSKSTADELEENLGMIQEIDGFLKIHRSSSISTLDFFKKLKVIHGKTLDNSRYALVVVENQNLQKLWNWNNFTLTIKRGTISFHYNPQLCLSEINKLAKITGLPDISNDTVDVSPLSNGDKTACKYSDLKVTIVQLTSTAVTIAWENLIISDSDKEDHLIGYLLYFIEDPLGNMTIYYGHDECGAVGWDSIFVSNNSHQIVNLKAYTQYAYYIKTYTTPLSIGGQTEIKHFITLSDHPSVPLDVKTNSSASNSVTLTWKPPEHPNGVLSYYYIVAYFQEDDSQLLAERDYCKFPHRVHSQTITEPASDIWNNSTTNATCCKKKEDTISSEKFVSLCDGLGTVYGLVTQPNQEKSMNRIEPKNYNDVKNSSFPSNSSHVIEKLLKDSNLTKYVFEPLRHFSMYFFILQACNSPLQCSSPIIISQRTLKKEDADDIPPGLSVDVEKYNAHVKWLEPKEPNSVIVSYHIEHKRTDLKHSIPVTKCITQQQIAPSGFVYRMRNFPPGTYAVRVRAISLAGAGRFSEYAEFEILSPSHGASPVAFIVPVFIVILFTIGALYYFLYYKKKHRLNHLHLITNVNPDYAGPIYVEDEWEIDRDDIDISKALGQGTFGMVYSGFIKSRSRPCALKTINEHTDVHDRMVFLNEASVMKSFSEAHHVVKLIGVVSRGEPPLVVMELMARGDLKSFLRKSRDSSSSITCAEMYRMAAEIADGMMYLAAKKFVHRDLAARNCMVADDHTVKVGDFGMTRDIYETDYYRKETRGLMPVRWMSPESLADGVFTTDSDVWSYGVVLWEMATLAEQPYQGLANEQVLEFVIAQGTLERPVECSDLLFEIMEACWKWRPNQRPLFADIVEKLESNVGQNFRLVSFYHSSGGEEYRMNAKNRVYNPPALTVPLNRNKGVHWNISEDDVSLYSSLESNRPTPLLSTFQNQSKKNTPSGDSYR